ncbi:protein disulfide isomerase-like 1-4 [Silene latifolia]|uniref:protein disulfide isomerase-like 1-4 n=1 Tax=Silene latifolia TaxID=37657 RepID=UPI003D782A45
MPSQRLVVAVLLLLSLSTLSLSAIDLDDEDLSFLEESDPVSTSDHHHSFSDGDDGEFDGGNESEFDDFDDAAFGDEGGDLDMPAVDEKDVVVLKERNFTDVVENNKYVMVEFYAPWCGHCQSLAPEYAAAATQLKDEGVDVVFAKIDATEENELAHQFDVQGFPTVFFFVDGDHTTYGGQRTKDGIVTWIKKNTGPSVYNITDTEEAEKILTSNDKLVLAYLNSLTGPESVELASASRLDDDVNFYQTVDPNVAKLFEFDAQAKRPALVLLKKDSEKINYFDGHFAKAAISEFVNANKLPLVTTFTRESASLIFESQIKKQLLLFATSNDSEEVLPTFTEAAKFFKGKIIFVYVQLDNEDTGKPVADYFGVTGDSPRVIAYTGNEDSRKFVLDGELTSEKVKAFGDGFLEDTLKPFYKSDPVPESNDGDVKIVVGNNFDEIVLDESKDVLLEIYAPWCGHCQSLEPTYNKLAHHLREINSIVIAKMDGTTNEHPRAKSDGFPTILFFPAGNKSFDPITVDTDRTVVAFYKFLKQHAAIPFKLQKPTSIPKAETSDVKISSEKDAKDLKDEL